MILLLDNYDSFVHNLARYLRRLDCDTRVVRSDQINVSTCRRLRPSAIVISPGPRHPQQAGCSVDVIRELSDEIPMLGVCLGHQAIGVAFGGSIRKSEPMHGRASEIQHDGQGIFAGCHSPMRVARYHSLAIDEQDFPKDLIISARSEDNTIMAIRHVSRPVFGLQFHPESVLTDDGLTILSHFVNIVSASNGSSSAGCDSSARGAAAL